MRLDEFLTVRGFFDSRTKSKQAIVGGTVFIDGRKTLKPSLNIAENGNPNVKIVMVENYVSLGGYKLSKALKDFGFSIDRMTVADIGASTGGFTDCLLQNGASKVYAVDLNDTLLHEKLKTNNNVVRVIKNAKSLTRQDLPEIQLITADLSFISAKQVLDVFYRLLPDNGYCILLIKPQFEIGEKRNFKNGIIKDDNLRKIACRGIYDSAIDVGFCVKNLTTAPINKDKNIEFLILFAKCNDKSKPFEDLYKF